jgi:hypothetical protein
MANLESQGILSLAEHLEILVCHVEASVFIYLLTFWWFWRLNLPSKHITA